MSRKVDTEREMAIQSGALAPDLMERASLAMDCLGWLTVHGFTVSMIKEGLTVEPDAVPEAILSKLVAAGPGFEFLFPEHQRVEGRTLGGNQGASKEEAH